MKRKLMVMGIIFALGTVAFFGCNLAPGDQIVITSFKNKTFVYIVSSNGMNKETYVFDDTGEAGTWETQTYSYNFATAADETSGNYDDYSFFQTGGDRGTFTWDEETYTLVLTRTGVYELKDSAVTTYEDDYDWRDLTLADDPNAWKTRTQNALFTEDILWTMIAVATDTENQWQSVYNEVEMDGDYVNETYTSSIDPENSTYTFMEHVVEGDSGATSADELHDVRTYMYAINSAFLKGDNTDDKTVEQIWKKGNTVNFNLTRTSYTRLDYLGDTAPDLLTSSDADSATGEASTGTMDTDYSYITLVLQTMTEILEYTNNDFIRDIYTADYIGAYRNLK